MVSFVFSTIYRWALTPAGEDGVNLSGDQRQLLGFCRSLYRKPQVLLLDEPIASLDRETASFVHNLIHNIKSSCIVLVVTHLSDLMLLADRIYQLNCKKVKEKNTRLLTSSLRGPDILDALHVE